VTIFLRFIHLFIGAFPGRVSYVVNKDGKVVSIFDDLAKAALHPDKALEALTAAAAKK
jgi:peroxiredoxin